MRLSVCHGLPLIEALICAGSSPASRRCAIARTSRTRRASSPTSRPTDSPWAESVEKRPGRGGAVARDERVDEAPHLALGGMRRGALDLFAADVGGQTELEHELLELAEEALLTLADERDECLSAVSIELDPELFDASPCSQRGGLPWPSAPARSARHRRPSRRPSPAPGETLKRPSLRPKNAIVVSGAIACSAGTR